MECRKWRQKGSRKSGLKVRGVARGRKCCGREMEWRKHVRSEAEWRKLMWKWKNGSEDILRFGRQKEVWAGEKSQNWKEKKQGKEQME